MYYWVGVKIKKVIVASAKKEALSSILEIVYIKCEK